MISIRNIALRNEIQNSDFQEVNAPVKISSITSFWKSCIFFRSWTSSRVFTRFRNGCPQIWLLSMSFATALHIRSSHRTDAENPNGKGRVSLHLTVSVVSLMTCKSSLIFSFSDFGEAHLRTLAIGLTHPPRKGVCQGAQHQVQPTAEKRRLLTLAVKLSFKS